jgi:hypothetical protein
MARKSKNKSFQTLPEVGLEMISQPIFKKLGNQFLIHLRNTISLQIQLVHGAAVPGGCARISPENVMYPGRVSSEINTSSAGSHTGASDSALLGSSR